MRTFFRDTTAARETRREAISVESPPPALRPAMEIIVRLSAERTRLREEVERLRSELSGAIRRSELSQLRRERDALAQQLATAQAELARRPAAPQPLQLSAAALDALAARLGPRIAAPQPAPAPDAALVGLVERLEQAVGRLQHAAPRSELPSGARRRTEVVARPRWARSTPTPRSAAGGPRAARVPGGGGGFLAGLVRDNLDLRRQAPTAPPSASAAPAPATATRQPATRQPAAPARQPASRGGGLLAGLVRDNVALRNAKPAPQPAAPPALQAPEPARTTHTPAAPAAPPRRRPRKRPRASGLGGLLSQNLALRGRGT